MVTKHPRRIFAVGRDDVNEAQRLGDDHPGALAYVGECADRAAADIGEGGDLVHRLAARPARWRGSIRNSSIRVKGEKKSYEGKSEPSTCGPIDGMQFPERERRKGIGKNEADNCYQCVGDKPFHPRTFTEEDSTPSPAPVTVAKGVATERGDSWKTALRSKWAWPATGAYCACCTSWPCAASLRSKRRTILLLMSAIIFASLRKELRS